MIHFWDTHREYLSSDEMLASVADIEYEHEDIRIDELPDRLCGNLPVMDHLVNQFSDVETLGDVMRRYDASIRYVDQHIGRIIDRLKKRGEYEDTLIVFTADHGEVLADFGREIFFTHRECYDPTWRVPLVIKGDDFQGKENRFVQHTDIVPTILAALGRDHDDDQFDGQSLVPDAYGTRELERDAVYMEQTHDARQSAIRTDRYKYIKNWERDRPGKASHLEFPSETLFDLRRDPTETENRIDADYEIAVELKQKMEKFHSSLPKPTVTVTQESSQEANEEVLKRLEAMGYKFD